MPKTTSQDPQPRKKTLPREIALMIGHSKRLINELNMIRHDTELRIQHPTTGNDQLLKDRAFSIRMEAHEIGLLADGLFVNIHSISATESEAKA